MIEKPDFIPDAVLVSCKDGENFGWAYFVDGICNVSAKCVDVNLPFFIDSKWETAEIDVDNIGRCGFVVVEDSRNCDIEREKLLSYQIQGMDGTSS